MSLMQSGIRIGISACLVGQSVRYDGGHKAQPLIVNILAHRAQLLPFCPEVAAGLGVPRPAVQLVAGPDGRRARGVADPQLDVTDALQQIAAGYCDQIEELELCGFILKSRSPSCGLGSTPLHAEDGGGVLGFTNGVFAEALRSSAPWLPCVEEEWLRSQSHCWRFLTACAIAAQHHGDDSHLALTQKVTKQLGLKREEMIRALLESEELGAALDGRLEQYWLEH